MTSSDDSTVREALRRLQPDVAAASDFRYRPLDGGIQRRSFLVETARERWVLRLPTPGAGALNSVATEAVAMRAAAAAGLAPRVIGVDVEHGLLLTEYRAGAEPWTEAAARRPANIARAVLLLRALHSVEADIPAYAAERIARGYLDALADGDSQRAAPASFEPERVQSWRRELLDLACWFDASQPPEGLCHNDLVAANVLDDGRLSLVDFEYAVRGSPLLDLAGLAGMNDFSPEQRRALLAAYYRPMGPDPSFADLDRAIRMVRLMSFFWAILGAHLAADAAPYSRLAAELGSLLERTVAPTSSR